MNALLILFIIHNSNITMSKCITLTVCLFEIEGKIAGSSDRV